MIEIRKQSLLKSIATLSAGRGLQTCLGFIHLAVVMSCFGGRGLADTYLLAYSLFGLAVAIAIQSLTFTFVPVFTDWRKTRGEGPAWEMAGTVLSLSLVVLGILAALVFLLAPRIAGLIGPGLESDPEKLALLTRLIRILSPALFLAGLGGIPRAIYASYRSFIVPATAALCVQTGLIAGTLAAGARYGPQATMVGGVAGVALQALLLGSIFYAKRDVFRPAFNIGHEGLKSFGGLLFIRILGIAASQANLLVDRSLATLAGGEGNVTALATSFRIANLLPQILIWSICEAIIAVFSGAWAEKDTEKIRVLFRRTVKALVFLAVPGAAFLAAARIPLVALLFQHGAFTEADTARAALPLFYYALNVPFALVNFLLLAVLWAIQDNWSVLKLAAVGLAVNVTGDVILLNVMGYSGIALANLPRGIILLVLATAVFNRKVARLDLGDLAGAGLRFLGAGAAAFLAGRGVLLCLGAAGNTTGQAVRIALAAAAMTAVYLAACRLVSPRELAAVAEFIRGRLRRGRDRGGAEKDAAPGGGETFPRENGLL